jgi:hypothetical protein
MKNVNQLRKYNKTQFIKRFPDPESDPNTNPILMKFCYRI